MFEEKVKTKCEFTPKIDSTTLGLLAFAALPVLWQIVDTIKAGGVELSFRPLAVHQQIFKLLDGIGAQRVWTFYSPRPGESELGQGLDFMIKGLLKEHEKEFIKQLETWLEADSHNLRWFAAEVIGYHKIEKLKDRLNDMTKGLDRDAAWEPWQLNCLWAHSRFDEKNKYAQLKDLLVNTTSDFNQGWVLSAYSQMAQDEPRDRPILAKHVTEFKRRADLTQKLIDEANELTVKLSQ